jgi:hypothetical protein
MFRFFIPQKKQCNSDSRNVSNSRYASNSWEVNNSREPTIGSCWKHQYSRPDPTSTAAGQAATIDTLAIAGTPGTKQQLLEQEA